jgi:hypothetical protein
MQTHVCRAQNPPHTQGAVVRNAGNVLGVHVHSNGNGVCILNVLRICFGNRRTLIYAARELGAQGRRQGQGEQTGHGLG